MVKQIETIALKVTCEIGLRALPQLTQEEDPEMRLSTQAASWFGEF